MSVRACQTCSISPDRGLRSYGGTYRSEGDPQPGQLIFEHFFRKPQDELAQRNQPEGIGTVSDLHVGRERCGQVPERTQAGVHGRQAVDRLSAGREHVSKISCGLQDLAGQKGLSENTEEEDITKCRAYRRIPAASHLEQQGECVSFAAF